MATWWEETTHLEKTLMLEKIEGRRRGNRGWDGWMESPTQWTCVSANSGRQWRTGKPGMLLSMGLQRVRLDLVTEHIHKHSEARERIQSVQCLEVFQKSGSFVSVYLITSWRPWWKYRGSDLIFLQWAWASVIFITSPGESPSSPQRSWQS